MDDLPNWLPAWCLDHLGGEPADVLFGLQQISLVFALRLTGGTDVVVKARADEGRAGAFARGVGLPTLAPIESSEAFLAVYRLRRAKA